jgi:hypothetical protein
MPFCASGVSRGWETHRNAGKSVFLLKLHPITGKSGKGNSLSGGERLGPTDVKLTGLNPAG